MGSMDMAYERGNFKFLNENNEALKHGRYEESKHRYCCMNHQLIAHFYRYVIVWKRVNGSMLVNLGVAQPYDSAELSIPPAVI